MARKHNLKRKYGLTPEEWEQKFNEQGRSCAACAATESGRKDGRWITDHDHVTGLVRGILCHRCNMVAMEIARVRAVLQYLEKYHG